MLSDPDLVPFEPSAEPRGLAGLPTLGRNYIEAWPRLVYEQRLTRFRTLFADVVFVCDPELIQEILVEKADAFVRDPVTRRSFTPVIGDSSLLLAEGAEWRWQRRAVARIFRHETLLSFVPLFAAMAERQAERWRSSAPERPVNAAEAMTRTTFDIIVEAMLSGTETLDAERYGRALTVNFETVPWHILYSMFGLPNWMPFPRRRRAARESEFLHRDLARIVAARRAAPTSQPDLLNLLLNAQDPETGRRMTDAEVVNNLLTFIAAGHETTAVALTWALWLIAKDEQTQQRLFEEAEAVCGHRPVAAARVEGLVFTRQVIEEAMRLYPPAPALGRQAKADIEIGGMVITPRTSLNIPTYALHRNALLWDHPNAFDPDRFAPERAKTRPRYAFLPFGGGQRVCIGASFAMIEAAVILATLIRAFRFRPVAGHKPRPVARVTLRPAGGMPLWVTPR